MTRDIKKIRKRIEARKRMQAQAESFSKGKISYAEKRDQTPFFPFYEENLENDMEKEPILHPLFRRDIFILKVLIAALLVLVVGISYQKEGKVFEKARQAVGYVMEEEFQFASVAKWYENRFGEPFALLPSNIGKKKSEEVVTGNGYTVPASGKITTTFKEDGQGVLVETAANQNVNAVLDGYVVYIGKKADLGSTVIIQHDDGSESWYANLGEINVKLYTTVKTKQVIGKVSNQDKSIGHFYFAMQKDEKFIDPNQVITFE